MTKDAWRSLFSRRGWLSEQGSDFRDAILGLARPLRMDRGDTLYRVGDPGGGVFGILSGSMAVYGGTEYHEPVLGNILRAGEWFGHTPALSGRQRIHEYTAAEPSQLLNVPLPLLRPLMAENADFARAMGSMADMGVRTMTRIARDLLMPDSARRLASVLLRVTAMGEVPSADESGYVLTQGQLGEMANMSRSQVNAALGRFKANGWIAVGYNRIRLLDVEALKTFAFGD